MTSLRAELSRFKRKYDVPAVTGGIMSKDGTTIDCLGEHRRDGQSKVAPNDLWHIGSCAKSITAVLCARLVEQGKIEWQTPIGELFPDLPGQDSGWADRTVSDVLHCIAGMPANPTKSQLNTAFTDSRPLPEQRSELAHLTFQAPPNQQRFVYSNLGYVLIGAAIDRICGEPFEAALQRHVLDPLGMNNVGYGPPPLVCGHHPLLRLGPIMYGKGKPAEPDAVTSDNAPVLASAGTLHISMDDWSRFLRLFITQGGDLLDPSSVETLLTLPSNTRSTMTMGWAAIKSLPGVSFGMQGSNTMWSACALLNEDCSRVSFTITNDGRSSLLRATPKLNLAILNAAG